MEKWRIETGPKRERRMQKRERERTKKKRTREDKPMPSLSAVHHLQLTNQSKKKQELPPIFTRGENTFSTLSNTLHVVS